MSQINSASREQVQSMIEAILEMKENGEEDWELLVREEELHALVAAHDTLTEVVDEIEAELEFRSEEEMKLGAGSQSDREYANQL